MIKLELLPPSSGITHLAEIISLIRPSKLIEYPSPALGGSVIQWLVSFADKNDCRIVLSGDTRQHHAVDRGDALRILEDSGVVTVASLTKIVRQQVPELRQAVQDLSEGRSQAGFDRLDS